jgi:hypothetical protein
MRQPVSLPCICTGFHGAVTIKCVSGHGKSTQPSTFAVRQVYAPALLRYQPCMPRKGSVIMQQHVSCRACVRPQTVHQLPYCLSYVSPPRLSRHSLLAARARCTTNALLAAPVAVLVWAVCSLHRHCECNRPSLQAACSKQKCASAKSAPVLRTSSITTECAVLACTLQTQSIMYGSSQQQNNSRRKYWMINTLAADGSTNTLPAN